MLEVGVPDMSCLLSELNLGREYLDTHFCDRRTIWGINIYVAPEPLFDLRSPMSLNDTFRDFIRVGLRREEACLGVWPER